MKKLAFIGLVFTLFFLGCAKVEGPGGTSSISGNVNVSYYNWWGPTQPFNSALTDDRVYIKYGDSQSYGEYVRTDENGFFQFKGLTPGNYTIYVFEADSTIWHQDVFTQKEVEVTINKNKEVVVVDDIEIIRMP